jgi:hypothetical protein
MPRLSLFATGVLVLVAATPVLAQQSRGGGGGGASSGFSTAANQAFGGQAAMGGFGQGETTTGFGDTSQFGQSTGVNALSSGIGTPASGLGLPPLGGSARQGSPGSTSSRSSAFGSTRASTGGSTGAGRGMSTGRNATTGMTGSRTTGRNTGLAGMSQFAGMNSMNRNSMNRGGRNNAGMGMGMNAQIVGRGVGAQQYVRPVIQFAMDVPPTLTPPAVAQSITQTFATNEAIGGLQQMQVNVEANGVATVRGTAQNERQRVIAAALLSLEPGVRAVRNEVVVPALPSLQNSR